LAAAREVAADQQLLGGAAAELACDFHRLAFGGGEERIGSLGGAPRASEDVGALGRQCAPALGRQLAKLEREAQPLGGAVERERVECAASGGLGERGGASPFTGLRHVIGE